MYINQMTVEEFFIYFGKIILNPKCLFCTKVVCDCVVSIQNWTNNS